MLNIFKTFVLSGLAVMTGERAMDTPFDQMGDSAFREIPPGAIVLDPVTLTRINEPADIAASFRRQALRQADQYDAHADEVRTIAQMLVANCPEGPLKMRAKKAGRFGAKSIRR